MTTFWTALWNKLCSPVKTIMGPRWQPDWPTLRTIWFCDFMEGYSWGLGIGLGIVFGTLAVVGWLFMVYALIQAGIRAILG